MATNLDRRDETSSFIMSEDLPRRRTFFEEELEVNRDYLDHFEAKNNLAYSNFMFYIVNGLFECARDIVDIEGCPREISTMVARLKISSLSRLYSS